MKVLLLLPRDSTYRYHGGFTRGISYAPLTLSVLAALIPASAGAEVTLVDEGVDKPVRAGVFDIVGITCVTASANRAYELADYWKKKGSYVLLGGVHPTLMCDEALKHCDTVFTGLAEQNFPLFFEHYLQGSPRRLYASDSGEALRSMPVPRRDLISSRYMSIPTVLANRGCQNNCGYCSIPGLWGNKNLTRPVEEVIEEIRGLRTDRIILLDPSPTSDREYAVEFFRQLAPLKIKWSGLSTIDVVNDGQLFDLMVQSGCEGILAGFESANRVNLQQAGKKTNNIDNYQYAVKQFHNHNIPVLGCFIAGFDEDTRESLRDTLELIDTIGIDLPRFSILTPFPGTALFAQFERENRILTRDWALYDTMHVVFQPRRMTPAELQEAFYELWKQSYSIRRIISRMGNTRKEKIIKLAASLGFKYYGWKLRRNR